MKIFFLKILPISIIVIHFLYLSWKIDDRKWEERLEMQIKHNEKLQYCPFCGYKFLDDQDSTHNLYNCRQCGRSFLVHQFADPIADTEETWMDIPGFQGTYQISNHLRVRSLNRTSSANRRLSGKIMSTYRKGHGQEIYVALCKEGRQKLFHSHSCRRH